MTEKDLIIQDLRRENAKLRARVPQCGMTMTNADHIRSMSDEELAKYLFEIGYDEGWPSAKHALEWLQQPPKEADNG